MTAAAAHFWSWQLIVAMSLNGVVQCLTVGAYASRLAGVLSGRVATAISLFNIIATTGRFASMIYTPILGSLSDAANVAMSAPASRQAAAAHFEWQLRAIVFAGALGTAAGAVLLPSYVTIYLRAIRTFERLNSMPLAMARAFMPSTALAVLRSFRLASPRGVLSLSLRGLPKDVLILNLIVTSVYGIGVISAAYASVLNPAAARTALLSSGLVNGLATVAYNIVVDPTSALITDQAVRGERSLGEVKSLVGYLALTAIIGFLLSQLLMVPAANLLERAAAFITGR